MLKEGNKINYILKQKKEKMKFTRALRMFRLCGISRRTLFFNPILSQRAHMSRSLYRLALLRTWIEFCRTTLKEKKKQAWILDFLLTGQKYFCLWREHHFSVEFLMKKLLLKLWASEQTFWSSCSQGPNCQFPGNSSESIRALLAFSEKKNLSLNSPQ